MGCKATARLCGRPQAIPPQQGTTWAVLEPYYALHFSVKAEGSHQGRLLRLKIVWMTV